MEVLFICVFAVKALVYLFICSEGSVYLFICSEGSCLFICNEGSCLFVYLQ